MPTAISDLWPLEELAARYPKTFPAYRYLQRTRDEPGGIGPYLRWIGRKPFTSDALLAEWIEARSEVVGRAAA